MALSHLEGVVELGDEMPPVAGSAERLDDELDDPAITDPNPVSEFAVRGS